MSHSPKTKTLDNVEFCITDIGPRYTTVTFARRNYGRTGDTWRIHTIPMDKITHASLVRLNIALKTYTAETFAGIAPEFMTITHTIAPWRQIGDKYHHTHLWSMT